MPSRCLRRLKQQGERHYGRHEFTRGQIYCSRACDAHHTQPLAAKQVAERPVGVHLIFRYVQQGNDMVFVNLDGFTVLRRRLPKKST